MTLTGNTIPGQSVTGVMVMIGYSIFRYPRNHQKLLSLNHRTLNFLRGINVKDTVRLL